MSICPGCGWPSAYIGLSVVECCNLDCDHYSESWAICNAKVALGQMLDIDPRQLTWDDDTVELWPVVQRT